MTTATKRHSRIQPVEAAVNNTDYVPDVVAPHGTRVKVSGGQIPNDDASAATGNAGGIVGRIDGAPYVARGGPNKGKLVQPVRVEGSREILGVSTDRLQVAQGERERASRSHTPGANVTQQEWDRIFGKKRR